MNFGHFECLSFDCYGTLIDWETGILSALRPILETHEVSAGHHALLELYGKAEAEIEAGPYRPYREILKEVLSRIGDVFGFEPSRKELESFSTSVMNWPAFTDSSQALRALATQYRLIILSNIDDDLFRFSQKLLGVEFDHVFTAQQIGSYKPSRQNFEYLIQHAGVPLNKILHVAQSLFHDIAPAKAMGISTVWVNRRQGLAGFGATPSAEAAPDATVPDLRSLAVLTGTMACGD
ncbi:MAG: haloacid dehalogenase type II [Chloroflexi bacterium]|nr:haloacid dehalogenase type II [Chloroflexota bacterium]